MVNQRSSGASQPDLLDSARFKLPLQMAWRTQLGNSPGAEVSKQKYLSYIVVPPSTETYVSGKQFYLFV